PIFLYGIADPITIANVLAARPGTSDGTLMGFHSNHAQTTIPETMESKAPKDVTVREYIPAAIGINKETRLMIEDPATNSSMFAFKQAIIAEAPPITTIAIRVHHTRLLSDIFPLIRGFTIFPETIADGASNAELVVFSTALSSAPKKSTCTGSVVWARTMAGRTSCVSVVVPSA